MAGSAEGSGDSGLWSGQFFSWIMCVFCIHYPLSPVLLVSCSPFQDHFLSLLHIFAHINIRALQFFPIFFPSELRILDIFPLIFKNSSSVLVAYQGALERSASRVVGYLSPKMSLFCLYKASVFSPLVLLLILQSGHNSGNI